jgi:1-acyl-sn-glycerol-3-phosphate acyltransferase
MFPVYRVSEGVENLNSNYETFKGCKTLFRKKGIVLIFSEGKCINEWHLRPLKKGTARLAIKQLGRNIPWKYYRLVSITVHFVVLAKMLLSILAKLLSGKIFQ